MIFMSGRKISTTSTSESAWEKITVALKNQLDE